MTISISSETPTIIRDLIPEQRRTSIATELFGHCYYTQLEPYVFSLADALSDQYKGAFWNFYSLSGGGFYMAPDDDHELTVHCENGFEGVMSADAFGIVCCMYAFSHLSFTASDDVAKIYARSYHLLREWAMDHREVAAIVAATD